MISHFGQNRFKNEVGTVTIEYAICIPVVVFFIGLIFFVANWFHMQSICTQAVDVALREGVTLMPDDFSKRQVYANTERVLGDKIESVNLRINYEADADPDAPWFIRVSAIYKMPDNAFGKFFEGVLGDVEVIRVSKIER